MNFGSIPSQFSYPGYPVNYLQNPGYQRQQSVGGQQELMQNMAAFQPATNTNTFPGAISWQQNPSATGTR